MRDRFTLLCKAATHERTRNGPNCPNTVQQTKPFSPQSKGEQIGNQDLIKCNYAAATNTLQSPTNDQDSKILSNCTDNGANRKEEKSGYDLSLFVSESKSMKLGV